MAEPSNFTVAEMPGLYGPFTMHERVLQKIWLQQDFASAGTVLLDGRKLEIVSPGRWNLLGGPDFQDAVLRLGGDELRGDVEVHFHARDWSAHGHDANPAFARVVLHVLLYPPAAGAMPSRHADGRTIPALVLLPLLHRSLEEYAADDALEVLTERDEWRRVAELANQPADAVRAQLRRLAERRWAAKVASARLRCARLGFEGAAHHTALEILGYRHNRVPMLAAAERWPLASWGEPEASTRPLSAIHGWQTHGVRPANHPRQRLAQYSAWARAVPDWPARLEEWAQTWKLSGGGADATTRQVRKDQRLAEAVENLRANILRGAIAGPRVQTLVCDGFLPLLAAVSGREELRAAWFHWFAGDVPDGIRRALPRLGVTGERDHPLCHGWSQGLLAWLIEREIRA